MFTWTPREMWNCIKGACPHPLKYEAPIISMSLFDSLSHCGNVMSRIHVHYNECQLTMFVLSLIVWWLQLLVGSKYSFILCSYAVVHYWQSGSLSQRLHFRGPQTRRHWNHILYPHQKCITIVLLTVNLGEWKFHGTGTCAQGFLIWVFTPKGQLSVASTFML